MIAIVRRKFFFRALTKRDGTLKPNKAFYRKKNNKFAKECQQGCHKSDEKSSENSQHCVKW